jgi:hypothetical protein
MIGVDPLGGPIFTDSRDLWRGKRMNSKNTTNTMNTTHKSKGKLTHTRYTPVVLVGLIQQLNRITRKRLQE